MKLYPVGIVGESNYQPEVRLAREGEPVMIGHEPDNPYDDLALRVDRRGGGTIGYIPKSHWLRDAIHEEGRGVAGTIASINNAGPHLGVVIEVTLTDDVVHERGYQTRDVPADKELGKRVLGAFWSGLTGRRK